MGEPALELPNTVVVLGPAANGPTSQNLPTMGGYCEIVFAPSGQVINSTSGRVVLWVWDTNFVSQPTLLTIYTDTGAVVAHQVAPWNSAQPISATNNPFLYTQDGQNSGE
jgi:hypothetical protein